MNTPLVPAAVLDITDRLPAPAPQAEPAAPRPYQQPEDTFTVADRYALIILGLVALIGAGVFGTSFVVLGLPAGGRDGLVATFAIGSLTFVGLLIAAICTSVIRDDFARFCANR